MPTLHQDYSGNVADDNIAISMWIWRRRRSARVQRRPSRFRLITASEVILQPPLKLVKIERLG